MNEGAASATHSYLTPSGIELQRVYNPSNTTLPPDEVPGQFPFTRGIHRSMYRGRYWTMRQYAGYGTAQQTNRRFRWLLAQGQTGLSVAFDLPTQIGLDADHPQAAGEVGRVGVHIGTLADMEALFDGIDIGEVSTSLTINATAPMLAAFYLAMARRRGVAMESLRGTLQNDILKEYIARGTYIYPVPCALRLATDVIEFAVHRMPHWNPISISGYHIREAGATAVEELAFTLANAEVYIRAALARGLPIDAFAPRLAFFFGCHNHFLEEVAKFRAARRLWARLMKERYGARELRSMALRFHVQTCGSTLTSQQPQVNVVRVALQALAAVLGGCQSLHTNSYDEALALPSREAAELALRTQQILACETGIGDTADPLGGAYALEELTRELEARVEAQLEEIRSMGGMLEAIARGIPQAAIQRSAYRAQKEVESGARKIVGVNCFSEGRPARLQGILRISQGVETRQKRALSSFRRRRDASRARSCLRRLQEGAKGSENLFPRILECVESEATLGEICSSLREVFGEYRPGS